jgi:membrane-associated PAP2 superfamily phosphatase
MRRNVRATSNRKPDTRVEAISTALDITWVWLGFIVLWEWSGGDRWVMNHLADSHGFALQNNWWLKAVFHDALRWISTLTYAALVFSLWKPFGLLRATSRLQRIEMLVGVSVALLVINRIKFYSLTSCPWDLAQFGGVATYVSHWSWGVGDGGPGRCFPGGHASAGYAFFALAMPGLFSDSPAARQTGKRLFVAVFLFGLICGASQVLRGAHYPSHGLWTGLICWVVAAVNHWLFGYAGKATALPDHPAAAQ